MNNEISILVVEDEEIWAVQLQLILTDFGFNVVKIARTVEEALKTLAECEYDLVLLDIRLNGADSGIELGKIINRLYKKPFIFITASPSHQLKEAADANPSAYLPKPINQSSLYIAIQNAINNFSANKRPSENNGTDFTSFFVKQGTRYKKIDWKDVVYLSAGKNYTTVFNAADKTEYFIRSSLQKILSYQVPRQLQKSFIQVNRAEALQLNFIQEFSNGEVKTAYKTFSVSENYTKEVKNKLNIIS